MTNEDLTRLADFRPRCAEESVATRMSFEMAELTSLEGGGFIKAEDTWCLEIIEHYRRIESEHLAMRDSFLARIGKVMLQ